MQPILPTKEQLKFLDWEVGVFFHFGIRTFYEGRKDWDKKPMDAAAFCPSQLDCRQWVQAAKAGGARYCVLTAKHHDGFALWQSKHTDYGVMSAPWKGGKGDVVREFTDACRAEGLGVGLYYSPAQVGAAMDSRAYDDYFIAQITELLTGYGVIDYLWFDGCGSEGHTYDRKRIVDTIRRLQPHILLFELWGPDTRWVGNEEGVAPLDAAYTVTLPADAVCTGERTRFLPYECDCRIRPDNWFWSRKDADTLRTAENLTALYLLSVGRGGNLLLNIGPDDRGLIPERDAAVFAAFGAQIRQLFAKPLPLQRTRHKNALTLHTDTPLTVSMIELQEDLRHGERAGAFAVYYQDRGTNILLCQGSTVGHRRILQFPQVLLGGPRALEIVFTQPLSRTLPDVRCFDPRYLYKTGKV